MVHESLPIDTFEGVKTEELKKRLEAVIETEKQMLEGELRTANRDIIVDWLHAFAFQQNALEVIMSLDLDRDDIVSLLNTGDIPNYLYHTYEDTDAAGFDDVELVIKEATKNFKRLLDLEQKSK